MDPARLLQLRRARLQSGLAHLLRARAALGTRRAPRVAGRASSRTLADTVLSALLAPVCVACEVLLEVPTRGPVCRECWESVHVLRGPFCRQCGDERQSRRAISGADERCSRCRTRPSPIT